MPERDAADTADTTEAADPGVSESTGPTASADDAGVDYEWVMQTTFVLTILVGAPLVALLSLAVDLAGWRAWAEFAVRVGALVWFVTAVSVAVYARFARRT